jgi:sulfate adenylyltransferase subunit 1 (EFTu-like GTPase family)
VQYTRNMVTGASTCQLAIILIDARHGVLTQTRRHSFIASLLGIRHVVVAVNKMDLVDWVEDRGSNEIRDEYLRFAAAARTRPARVRPADVGPDRRQRRCPLSGNMPGSTGRR